MKKIVACLCALMFVVLSYTDAVAQGYAIVTMKNNPGKKYYATEMGYSKDSDSLIVYYEKPKNDRFIQSKDVVNIVTKLGKIDFHSEKNGVN